MANWSLPTVGDLYTDIVALFKGRDDALATQFDTSLPASTNLPEKTKRWNGTTNKWEVLNAGSWSNLSNNYNINIAGNAATAALSSDSLKLGGLALNNFVRTISGTSPDASGNVVVNTSDKLSLTGGTLSGQLTINGAPFTVYDVGGTTGRVNLNAAKTRYLNYNGTNYELPGGALYVNGAIVYTAANLDVSNSRTYPRRSDGTNINFIWSGQGNLNYYWGSNDGVNMYPVSPSSMSVGNASTVGGYNQNTWFASATKVSYYDVNGSNVYFRLTRLDGSYTDLWIIQSGYTGGG
jgi:hypothetical protein